MDTTTNGHSAEYLATMQALSVATGLLSQLTSTWTPGLTFGGDRDIYTVLGYKVDLTYRDYRDRYARGGIAARLINAFPAATWREAPELAERNKPDDTLASDFELAWQGLVDRLHLYRTLERTDRLASIGNYAGLVLGLRGQTDFSEPAQPVSGPDDLLYLSAYSQEHVRISELVAENDSPLFGQPKTYQIDFSRRNSSTLLEGERLRPSMPGQRGQTRVHASRVIHLAENGLEDDIIGTPRLRPVWNYLDDLDKLIGGTAEMVWQDAPRRFALLLDKEADLDDDSRVAMKEQVDRFVHNAQRFMRLQGMNVEQFEGHVPDASGNIDKTLQVLAGAAGIPVRMLLGSERGELASSQDESNWAQTIAGRQHTHAGPFLRRLVDRCIGLRALPQPAGGYDLWWPPLVAPTELERSTIALNWTRAIATFAGQLIAPEEVFPLEVFLRDIMDRTPEEVQRILRDLGRLMEEDMAERDADAQLDEQLAEVA